MTHGTILIADDEELIRRVLADALSEEGYTAETADSGARAWERLQAMHDVEFHFAGDHQLVFEQQVIVAMDRAADGVLERHDTMRRSPFDNRLEHIVKALARDRLDFGSAVQERCGFAVRPGFSLISESHECSPTGSADLGRHGSAYCRVVSNDTDTDARASAF